MTCDNENDLDNYDLNDDDCPACGGTGKANVNESGDVEDDNPDDLDCDYCQGTGQAD